ncbi:hypothetical protein [Halovenus salina]|uniref:hypothetical protein n=1 Tax=Halovenus salina TaxID=1510225 RepID=UPI0036D355D8
MLATRYFIIADSNLDDALVELLTAILDNQTGNPSVSLTCSVPAEGTLRIDIHGPDELFPPSDRAALKRGGETQLEHGGGLGLWLANWIIENGHGTLAFPADEPRLRIELNRVAD